MLDCKKDLNDFSELNTEELQNINGGSWHSFGQKMLNWNIKHAQQMNNVAGAVGSFYNSHDYYNK